MATHARPRATLDVDLLVPRESLDGAKAVARACGYVIDRGALSLAKGRVLIHRLSKPDPETGDLLSLDLLEVTPAVAEAWTGRERVGWEHGTIHVVSRPGLVSMKRPRGSGQDQDDIRYLEGGDGEA
jgi:hypothetical protein